MKCIKCHRAMRKIDRRDELAELNDDATEGQMADYFAAELSGDNGAWNLGIVEYFCPNCNLNYQNVTDQLPNYYPLIWAWHDKAAEGDTFSRFVLVVFRILCHFIKLSQKISEMIHERKNQIRYGERYPSTA